MAKLKATKEQIELTNQCIQWSKDTYGTKYHKVMIEGNTGIYYASEIYRHNDYNKTRLFDKNKATLQLMDIFHSQF